MTDALKIIRAPLKRIVPSPFRVVGRRVISYIRERSSQYSRFKKVFGGFSSIRLMVLRTRETPVRVYSQELRQYLYLRPNTSDLEVTLKILEKHEYAINVDFVPGLIIDAGANIGISALYFAKRFPRAVVHAIEPDSGNFSLLKANCRNMLNVVAHHAAIWPYHTSLSVIDPAAEKWAFAFHEGDDGGTQAITVLDVMQQARTNRIDIFKLDIEGGEKALFEHPISEWLPSVRMIIIELHDRYIPGCSESFYSSIAQRRFSEEISGENLVVRFWDE